MSRRRDERMSDEAFTLLCNALRNNESIWHDNPEPFFIDNPIQDEIRDDKLPTNYGNRLGEALLMNSHVRELSLCVERGRIDRMESDFDPENIASLLRYFQETPYLQHLTLSSYYESYEADLGPCLRAVAMNSNIPYLTLQTRGMFPSTDMAFLLQTTQPLRTLVMPVEDDDDVVADAFSTNQSLDLLIIHTVLSQSTICHGNVLGKLGSNHCLRELHYSTHRSDGLFSGRGFTTLLSTSLSLRVFKLNCWFTAESMECLVAGLRTNNLLTHLVFDYCRFNEGATDVLTSYLQTSGNNNSTTTSRWLSYELDVYDYDRQQSIFQYRSTAVVIPRMLQGNCGLPVLHLRGLTDGAVRRIWESLEVSAHDIQLPCLKLDHSFWSEDTETTMYYCLPQLLHMKELHLRVPDREGHTREFELAVRRNGSLHQVKRYEQYESPESFDNHIVQASCQRNQFLPELLVNDTYASPEDKDLAARSAVLYDDVSIYPALFSVAQQVPRYRSKWILMGVITLSGSAIGPINDEYGTMNPN